MLDLSRSPIGRTVRIRGHDHRFDQDYELEAYLPDPLPESVPVDNPTWLRISDAMVALGRLDAATRQLPNPGLVTRYATRVEAVGTSALEGTYAELPELFAAEVASGEDATRSLPPHVREVLNYAVAAELGHTTVTDQPITRGVLSQLHAIIVGGTASDGPEAGKVRTRQVFIGAQDQPITDARFIPPPPGDQLTALLDDWLEWVEGGSGRDLQLLVRVAVSHYQFEAIHPFHDGNGRLGRLAATLQLRRAGLGSAPVLAISPWLKTHEDAYKDGLLELSATGEWGPWIAFFAEAIHAAADSALVRVERLLGLVTELSQQVRDRVPRGRLAVDIVDDLVKYPILSVADAERRYGRTNQAARNAIEKLVDVGLLEPYNSVTYRRLYWNPRVFQVAGSG